jgi:excisionase family DNA binding protein
MSVVKEPEFEIMLTVADVCKFLSVFDETVYSWIRGTDIPAARVGKRRLFDKAEFDQWIKAGRTAGK